MTAMLRRTDLLCLFFAVTQLGCADPELPPAAPGSPGGFVGGGAVASGGGDDVEAGEVCGTRRVETEERTGPVDLLVAADQSGSMELEWDTLGASLSSLVAAAGAEGVETRVAATDPIVGCPTCDLIDVAVTSGNALEVLARDDVFFERDGGVLELLVLTDDESSLSGDAFIQTMASRLDRPFRVHAVAAEHIGTRAQRVCGTVTDPCRDEFAACPLSDDIACLDVIGASCAAAIERGFGDCARGGTFETGATTCTTASRTGQRYEWLAHVTGGAFMSMCEFDSVRLFDPLLDLLRSDRVQNVLPCEIRLPDGATLDRDRVTVVLESEGDVVVPRVTECGAALGYQRTEDMVTLCPSVCAVLRAPDESVRVDLACADNG